MNLPLKFTNHELHMRAIMDAVLSAADPEVAVAHNLKLEDGFLCIGSYSLPILPEARIYLVGLGKAAPSMCRAAVERLGPRLAAGVAAVPYSYSDGPIPRVQYFAAGHPLPDEGSLAAGRAVVEMLKQTRSGDLVLALISGGGSAMIELPQPGIDLQDLRILNKLLLISGAPIQEINIVRKSISQIKAGGLARLAAPAQTAALILSDVVGDRLSSIASGPTVLRGAKPEDARRVLKDYSLWSRIPESIRCALSRERWPVARVHHPKNIIIGSNRLVVQSAAKKAKEQGFSVRILSLQMRGEASLMGVRLATRIRSARRPVCLLMGGETTVTVHGTGKGGRNQQLALAAALALEGVPTVAAMCLATDGIDGPTDAAGAMITGETVKEAHKRGLKPREALHNNDAYPLLDEVGALIRTGPTGTNLNDIVVGLTYWD